MEKGPPLYSKSDRIKAMKKVHRQEQKTHCVGERGPSLLCEPIRKSGVHRKEMLDSPQKRPGRPHHEKPRERKTKYSLTSTPKCQEKSEGKIGPGERISCTSKVKIPAPWPRKSKARTGGGEREVSGLPEKVTLID